MTLLIAIVALLALVAATAAEIFDMIAPALGVVVPVIVAFAVRARADWKVKQITAIVVTIGVSVASLAMEDWAMVTWALAGERVLLIFAEAHGTYLVVSAAVERWTPARSINELEVFRPHAGVG